ncbi:MAG TPA: crosslink repair DNA glycosylase YcaQ family protein, partial [Thermoanaerobaculia bacterium]|nr:crosslink repair DNA glycosylase YcaQ family protein [Thermoanaerobaculia bacterium]
RLDSERYRWRAAAQSPFEGIQAPEDSIDLFAGMARIFFQAAGLGTQKDFAGWAGISQRDAKAAIERVAVLPVAVDGDDEVHYLLEERRGLPEESADAVSAVAFLPFEDNLIHLHGGPARVVDEAHHAVPVPVWGSGKTTTIGEARHMSLRSVVAEGKVSGFWEFDPDAREVVYKGFEGLSSSTRKKMDATAQDLSRFLAEDLGHGRSFTLDTDEELRKRSAQVRGM